MERMITCGDPQLHSDHGWCGLSGRMRLIHHLSWRMWGRVASHHPPVEQQKADDGHPV